MYSINFISSNPIFCQPLVNALSSKYNVRTYFKPQIQSQDEFVQFAAQMRDSDVNFIDWCDPYVAEAAKGLKTCKIICRLHSYEYFDGMMDHVNWQNVDRLIFVNHSISELTKYRTFIDPKKIKVIYHGIDLEKFKIKDGKKKTGKVGIAGFINFKKDPSIALACFDSIHRVCPDLTFHWVGEHQDLRHHLNFIHMSGKLPFKLYMEPWSKDMNKWYEDKDYILSSSIFETCHLSILEGMASGVLPLVRMWRGADYIYPSHSLFTSPDICARKVQIYESDEVVKNIDEFRENHRGWVDKHFNFTRHIEEIDKMLVEVIKG